MVAQINSTLADIRTKVRRLTASHTTSQLTNDDLDKAINTAYSQDIPADIKSFLFKEVVAIYTKPNIDRYALSGTLLANTGPDTYESIRDPVYVEGRAVSFYKDRGQFYSNWPKLTSLDQSLSGDGVTTAFTLTVGLPILQNEITLGVRIGGLYINFKDDGDKAGTGTGKIFDVSDAGEVSQGTVVYSTGVITLNFLAAPDSGEQISIWYFTYTAGQPSGIMWWKDEIVVRPVPDKGYKIEVEAYRYPTQFTSTGESPTLKQWWQYIAFLAAIKILEERDDMEGIENLAPLAKRQEVLIRNRMANEQIGQKNATIYDGAQAPTNYPFNFWG